MTVVAPLGPPPPPADAKASLSWAPSAPSAPPSVTFRSVLAASETTRGASWAPASTRPWLAPGVEASQPASPQPAAKASGEERADPAPRDRRSRPRETSAADPAAFALQPVFPQALAPLLLPSAPAPAQARSHASLEDLLPAFVRRIAWSGDRQRATMRLEIGAGDLDGATLLVHAREGQVRVQLDVPPGVDARAWQARISQRLAARGIPTDGVEVT